VISQLIFQATTTYCIDRKRADLEGSHSSWTPHLRVKMMPLRLLG
jgi:hypothetical protein